MVIGLDLFNNPLQTTFSLIKITIGSGGTQIPWSSAFDETSRLYVGTSGNLPQGPPSSTFTQSMAINSFSVSATAGGPWSATYSGTQYNGINYSPRNMRYSSFGPSQNALYIAADSVTNGLLFVKKDLSTSVLQSYIYEEAQNDPLIALDVLPQSFNTMFVLMKNTPRNIFALLTIQFSAPNILISKKILSKPYITLSDLTFARATSTGDFFLSGTLSSFGNPGCITGTNMRGFIASTNSNSLCQPFLFVDQITSSTYSLSSVTYQSYSFPSASSSIILSTSTVTSTIILQAKLYTTHNNCCDKQVTTQVLPNHRYIIDYPPETYQMPLFILNPGQCTDIFDFWYWRSSNPLIPSSPGIGEAIYFQDAALYFKAETSDSAHGAIYNIQVTSVLPNHQSNTGSLFQIELFNIPPSTYIIPMPLENINYIVRDPAIVITCSDFVSSDPTYYIIYYLEVLDPITNQYTREYDASLFGFTQGAKTHEITLFTEVNQKKGTYQMRLVGKFTPNTAFVAYSEFTVIIYDQCYRTSIMPSSNLPSQVDFIMTSPPSNPVVFSFSEWKESLGICAPFVYKASRGDGSYLPGFIQFNAVTRQFSVQQTKTMAPGEYGIAVKGTLANFYMFKQLNMQVNVYCVVSKMTTTQKDQTINYVAGSPALLLSITDFAQEPSCQKDIEYSAQNQLGGDLPRKHFSFEQKMNSFGLYDKYLVFQAEKGIGEVEFNIAIKASVVQDIPEQKKVTALLKIKIRVIDDTKFTESTYPPLFQMVKAGSQWKIPFVQKNTEGDGRMLQSGDPIQVKFVKKVLTYMSGEVSTDSVKLVPTDQPPTSYDFEQGMLTVSPKREASQGTRYIIEATVQDEKTLVFRILQQIVIIISNNDDGSIDLAAEQKMMLALQQQTLNEINYKAADRPLWLDTGVELVKKPDPSLKILIRKIDSTGLVYAKFTKPILQIENITLVDTTVLHLNVTTAYEVDSRNLSDFTWSTVFLTENEIRLQINFAKPEILSAYDIWDTLVITVIQNEFFLTQQSDGSFRPIAKNHQAKKKIPKLIKSGDQAALGSAQSFSKGIFSLLLGNALIALFLASSFSSFWSLIHVSQLMMTIPLMNIALPGSAQTVFLTMQSIISFDLVETSQIPNYDWFLNFQEDAEDLALDTVTNEDDGEQGTGFNPRFDNYGYEYLGMIQNMGSGFVWLVLSFVYQGFVYLAWKTTKALEIKVKFVENTQKRVFFGMTLGTFVEGCLEFCICGIINVLYANFSSPTETFSSAFSIFVLFITLAITVLSFILTKTNRIPKRFESLYQGLKEKDPSALAYTPLSMLRRIIIVLNVIFLSSTPLLQILFFLSQSLFFTWYLIYKRPFDDPKAMNLEIFNELMLLLCANTLFVFTEYCDEGILEKYNFGWGLAAIMLFTVGVNTLIAAIDLIQELAWRLKKMYYKVKMWCIMRNMKKQTVQMQPLNDDSLKVESFDASTNPHIDILFKRYRQRRLLQRQSQGYFDHFQVPQGLLSSENNPGPNNNPQQQQLGDLLRTETEDFVSTNQNILQEAATQSKIMMRKRFNPFAQVEQPKVPSPTGGELMHEINQKTAENVVRIRPEAAVKFNNNDGLFDTFESPPPQRKKRRQRSIFDDDEEAQQR